ncbi:MAG TPA: radical SAM protein [Patescibacteria group bacterium]|nr:radical SAM protein [Patescibacteria group bacterium]
MNQTSTLPEIILVVLPFYELRWPHIGLSYLSAVAKLRGRRTRVLDLNRRLYDLVHERIPAVSYKNWTSRSKDHPGQLIMSELLFPQPMPNRDSLAESVRSRFGVSISALKRDTLEVMTSWLHEPWTSEAGLVGLSVLNTQLLPALVVAEAVKKAKPHVKVVVGGFSCTPDGANKLLESCPHFDIGVVGEGENTFRQLIDRGFDSDAAVRIRGTVCRAGSTIVRNPPRSELTVDELERLPYPDYSWVEPSMMRKMGTELPVLGTRGCWWGRCRFCSDTIHWKKMRSRSPEGVVDEIEHQSAAYGWHKFYLCDLAANVTPERLGTFCDEVERRKLVLEIGTMMLRPHPSLDRGMLDRLLRVGVRCVQFGMESFSTPLLRKMGKGLSKLDNIRALRFGHEVGIRTVTNIITHYPAETVEEVEEIRAVVASQPGLFHRESIAGMYRFRLRPGAAIANDAEELGLKRLDSALSSLLFPPGERERYPVLEFEVRQSGTDEEQRGSMWKEIADLVHRDFEPEKLPRWYTVGDRVIVDRFDPRAQKFEYLMLSPHLGRLLLYLDEIRSDEEIASDLVLESEEIHEALSLLEKHDLIITDGEKHFSVVLPGTRAATFRDD